MEDEYEKIQNKVGSTENELAYWKEVLQKSEKYERLMAEPDFLGVLEDILQNVNAHDKEIKTCLEGMSEYSPKMLQEAQHTMMIHQILKEQAQLAIDRPRKIVELAKEARKKIPQIEESILKMKEEANA